MVTAGGEAIADIDTLRHQQQVLGPVASPPTAWRALDELTPAALKRIATARAKTRARVWGLIPGGVPASTVAGTVLPADVIVLDVDATIVRVHSEKESAAATFKRTFGYHPLGVWCDNTQELLAGCSCARATPGPTPPPTTSPSWARRSTRSPRRTAGTCWCAPTVPAPPTTSWTGSPG